MKRLVKWLLGLVASLLLLAVIAIIGITLFIDPNDYRDTIAEQVKEQTGRTLTIGEIKLSRFPWLGLELTSLELGNAEGFGKKPMARIGVAEARVKLLPLLKAQVEVDTVTLRGMEANLSRRANGTSNWDDLAGSGDEPKAVKEEEKDEGRGQPIESLAIGGIIIEDANVSWDDKLNKQQFSLQNFDLNTGEIRIGETIALELSAQLASSAPKLEGAIQFSGDITADPQAQRYRIDGMSLGARVKGDVVPGGSLDAKVGGDVAVDLNTQSLKLAQLGLSAMGLELKLNVEGKQIIDKPAFSGTLSSNEFVPNQLLTDLGIALPEMADPSVMGKAKLSSTFQAGLDSVALSELSLQLDDTTFSGKASVANFAAPVIRYDLKLDEIDVDRYLPPPSEQPDTAAPQKTVAATPSSGEPELPLELLRSLDINGTFTVGKVKVMNLRSHTINTTVKARDGKFRIHPLSAKLYEGSYNGNLGFDVSGKVAKISMNEKLSGVQAGPLLTDFMGKPLATGTANLTAQLTARGLEPMAIRKSLNGKGNFKFKNGTVNGINIGQQIRNAYALYKKQPQPKEEDKSSDFADLSGVFSVKNGLVSITKLAALSPLLQVDGKGTVNLVSEKLDMRLDTTLIHRKDDIATGGAEELGGQKIPVTIKGSFSDPKIGVDVASVLKAKAKAKVDAKKAEARAELERKKAEARAELERKKKAAEEEAKKKLENKLKNMLKF